MLFFILVDLIGAFYHETEFYKKKEKILGFIKWLGNEGKKSSRELFGNFPAIALLQ